MEEINKMISRAKIGLLQNTNSVFISTICFSLELVVTEEISTAATNGKKLLINPVFFKSLNLAEQVFLLAHESLHVAYMHMLRLEGRNHKKWNMACDYVINSHLQQAGYSVIKGALLNYKYKGKSSEQVYDMLSDEDIGGDFPMMDLQDPGTGDATTDEAIAQEIEDIVVRANLQSSMSGGTDVPEEVQRYLSDLLKPKVDWRKVLARFLMSMSRADYSFKKFNRKYLKEGLYLPTLVSEGNLSQVDFAVDVSGSVTETVCTQFCSEIYAVLKQYQPEQIGVYQWGSRVCKTDTVRSFKDLTTMKFVNGGGTRISPVLEHFKTSKAKALIILTDGEISQNDQFSKPDHRPIIWCIYDNPNFTCDFGKVIHISFKSHQGPTKGKGRNPGISRAA